MKFTFFIAGILMLLSLQAQKPVQHIEKGNESYRQNQFNKAKEEYNKALQKDEMNAIARFNSGNASMKLKQYGEAAKAFETAASGTSDPILKAQAFYNQGLAYVKQNKLSEAVDAFKKSLRLNPNDNDTRENLQKALKELTPQQKPNDKKNNKNKKDPKDKEQPQQPKTQLTKEEAERLLNKLQKEEKDLQKQVQKKNQSSRQLKDW